MGYNFYMTKPEQPSQMQTLSWLLIVLLVALASYFAITSGLTMHEQKEKKDTIARAEFSEALQVEIKAGRLKPINRQIHGEYIIDEFFGTCIKIVDGDVIEVQIEVKDVDAKSVQIRLAAIDAPENSQAFGRLAQDRLSELLFGKRVGILKTANGRKSQVIGFVLTEPHREKEFLGMLVIDGHNVNAQLVREGFAWNDTGNSKSDELPKLQTEAQAAKRGLWGEANPIPPWEWRKKN